jgi:hypothetical protein
MAMQGYTFHRSYEGKKYEPFIYTGLYNALTQINSLNYNAMKVDGPPRVHMRSLVVSDKNAGFFVAGADGRIYKETITNLPTLPLITPIHIRRRLLLLAKTKLIWSMAAIRHSFRYTT